MTLNEKIDKLTPNDRKFVEDFIDNVIVARALNHRMGYLGVDVGNKKRMAKISKLMRKISADKRPLYIQWRNAKLKGAVIGSLATLAIGGCLYLYKAHKD